MNPLMLKIMMGQEDKRLLHHIDFLEACRTGQNGSAGISPNELAILQAAWDRLDLITTP